MLDLLPGTDLNNLRAALVEARRTLTQARNGTGIADRFNLYNEWAANTANLLRYLLSPADIDRLVTTRLYWSLLGKSPVDVGSALVALVDNELQSRENALTGELGMFDAEVAEWHRGKALAIIPDTSVLVELGASFPEHPWHKELDVRPHVPILLVVTMAAVAELDDKKQSRDNSTHGQHVRAGVRAALRRIEELFPTNESRLDVTHREVITSTVTTVLLTDRLRHVPLVSADAEIISRGLMVKPYAGRCLLVTYDLAQTFRARAAGIEAHRMTYADDDAKS